MPTGISICLNLQMEYVYILIIITTATADPYHPRESTVVGGAVPKQQSSLSRNLDSTQLGLSRPSQVVKSPPEFVSQAVSVGKVLPSARAHAAKGIIQRVKGEA